MEVVWIVTECSEGQHPSVNAFFDCAAAKKHAASSTATTVDMTWHKVVDSQLHELAMEFANAAADWFLARNVLDAPWVQWDRMSETRAAFIAERKRVNEQQ